MTPQVAQLIIRDFQQSVLTEYVADRLSTLYKDFETIRPEDLKTLQGRIQEVKLLLKIREQAQGVLDQARKGKKWLKRKLIRPIIAINVVNFVFNSSMQSLENQ